MNITPEITPSNQIEQSRIRTISDSATSELGTPPMTGTTNSPGSPEPSSIDKLFDSPFDEQCILSFGMLNRIRNPESAF
jgi:hypothetical protein